MLTLVLEKLKTRGCWVVVVVVGGGCVCVSGGWVGGGRGGGRLAKLNQATVEVHKSARPTCSQVSVLLPGGGGGGRGVGGGWWRNQSQNQNQNQNQGPERSSEGVRPGVFVAGWLTHDCGDESNRQKRWTNELAHPSPSPSPHPDVCTGNSTDESDTIWSWTSLPFFFLRWRVSEGGGVNEGRAQKKKTCFLFF